MSSRTEPRAIASQLVLRFTLAAAVLLSCSLGAFYWIVVRHTVEEDNAVLADKLEAVRADIEHERAVEAIASELNSPLRGESLVHWIRIVDGQGRVVAETAGMRELLPPNLFPLPLRSTSSVTPPINLRTNDHLFALGALPQNNFTIQIAQDRSADDAFRREFRTLFLVVLGIGILAAALIAISVTRRGLRPLVQMTQSVERVRPAHFGERFAPNEWPRELRPLAIAFDDMLHRLQDSFDRLSQFSADLAHELRTPISNILGEAQVSLTRDRTADEYRQTIESTVMECERLSGIADNLLFLARAEAAERQIERKQFDARAAVEEIAEYYRAAAEDRHVTITCNGRANIFADATMFRRAVGNVVDNALRVVPNEGKIDIEVSADDSQTEIVVRDNGPGIPPQHLARVFDRFYRVDPSRSQSGAGLGLSLVKSIVDLHGGNANIDSDGRSGTTVRLTFSARGNSLADKITKS